MFDSLFFWVCVLAVGAMAVLIDGTRRGVVETTMIGVSIAVLVHVVSLPLWTILLIAGVVFWVAFTLRCGCRPWLVTGPVVLLWVGAKIGAVWPESHLGQLLFIGFSFAMVKIWTLARDVETGKLKAADPLTIAAYLTFFPTYTAGPMFYYSEFRETLDNPAPRDAASVVDAVFRIVLGIMKTTVVAPLLMPASVLVLPQAETVTLTGLVGGSVIYSIIIFCDFSGYSDLAIGSARLMGVKVPENFNNPYLAPNLREFWQRWHITFTRVLTSYVFVPVSRFVSQRCTDKRVPLLLISYLFTFAFCGFWHGSTANFLIWGVYHGLGLVVYDLYKPWATRRRLKLKIKRGKTAEAVLRLFSIIGTFLYVSVGWIPFALPTGQLASVLGNLIGL